MSGEKEKIFRSKNYNYKFNLENGLFYRWGETLEDDPLYCEYGPEILDIEISTICSNNCPFCYKTNTIKGRNMSFKTFKELFAKFPPTLTQIAFGIGDVEANPDLWKIMSHCRQNNIIPNITINGNRVVSITYDKLVKHCGAVAVSLYDYDNCYNAVQELSKRGLEQVNIHALLSEETFDKCIKVMKDSMKDKRLKKLNAIVFLWLKPKGNRNTYHQLSSMKKFKSLVDFAFTNNIRIGFDSCSSSNFLKAIKNHSNYRQIEQMVEPCESTLFSYYINVDAKGYPCSFAEGIIEGVDMLEHDFSDVWQGKTATDFRNKVLATEKQHNCRQCTIYNLEVQ